MKILTKKNALVGFVTLKALERRRKRGKRHARRLAGIVALGLVSAGILAALVVLAVRKQRGSHGEPQRLEGYAVADELGDEVDRSGALELDSETSESSPE